jgi:hypothetical protein
MKTQRESRKTPNQGRRGFLKVGGASIAANVVQAALPQRARAQSFSSTQAFKMASQAVQEMMPTRNLGKTGFRVGIFGLGGQGALEKVNNEAVALPIIQKALELGVNYFDTSAIYGGPDRWSQQYLGKGLKGYRDQVFIASKTKERTRDAALKNPEVSFKLLNTDHLGQLSQAYRRAGRMQDAGQAVADYQKLIEANRLKKRESLEMEKP